MPQKLAGRMMEAPVWVPMAAGTMPMATATAEPLDEVPGERASSWGLRVLPRVCTANSAVTVLPGMSAPASRSRATVRASLPGWKSFHRGLPIWVGKSTVLTTSLMPPGTPSRRRAVPPERRRASQARACASSRSGSKTSQARTLDSHRSTRRMQRSATSTGLSSPEAKPATISAMPRPKAPAAGRPAASGPGPGAACRWGGVCVGPSRSMSCCTKGRMRSALGCSRPKTGKSASFRWGMRRPRMVSKNSSSPMPVLFR